MVDIDGLARGNTALNMIDDGFLDVLLASFTLRLGGGIGIVWLCDLGGGGSSCYSLLGRDSQGEGVADGAVCDVMEVSQLITTDDSGHGLTALAGLSDHLDNNGAGTLESVLRFVEFLPGLGLDGVARRKTGAVHVGEKGVDRSVLRHSEDV